VGGIDVGRFGSGKSRGWGGEPFNGGGKRVNVMVTQSPTEEAGKGSRPEFRVAVAVLLNGEDNKGRFHCLCFCVEEAEIG
jgi:hypothetical protein